MAGDERYAVEIPDASWRGVGMPWPELEALFRSELERLAEEVAAQPGHGHGARTLNTPLGFGAIVLIDHEARRLRLGQVMQLMQLSTAAPRLRA